MTEKEDAEKLMAELLGFAQKMLEQHGEFHPFGGYLSNLDEIVQVGAEGGTGRQKIDQIERAFRELAASGKVRVFGVVSNIELTTEEDKNRNAIQIFLEHRDDYCADIFFRYQLKRAVEIIETIAQKGDKRLFSLRH